MLSHKEKKILAAKRERDQREIEKRQRFQENVQSLQELQRLLLQVRPDLASLPQTQLKEKTKKKSQLSPDIPAKQTTLVEISSDETASAEEKEEESNNSHNIEDDEYVKDFETEPAIVENDYYYL
mmetsp:Transcript_21199/g.23005  ORF Transcript_21199/g.23005 Transcript_21199/m.23005 type:complete len:125 (+) Transcript_21199:160-534(+)|eukprot:gene1740-1847_t